MGPHLVSDLPFPALPCFWRKISCRSGCGGTCTVKPERLSEASGSSRADQSSSPASRQMSRPGRVQMVAVSGEERSESHGGLNWTHQDNWPRRRVCARQRGLFQLGLMLAEAGLQPSYSAANGRGHGDAVGGQSSKIWQAGVIINSRQTS